jgi:acyl-ACP thioesterase
MQQYTEKYEITCHDVDENNNIRPTCLMRYMQETANHQMRDRKPSYYDLFFEGKAFIVTRMNIEIYRQLHQYEHIVTGTWRNQEKGATFPRCYEVRCGEEVVARAYSDWAVANRNTGKLCRSDEIDISGYETGEALELDIPKRFHFPKDMKFEKVGQRHVFYSDVDMNRHMTNTQYANMVWDYIPGIIDKEVTSINIRFMKEAPLDADIDIYMARADLSLAKDKNAEELYAFMTKVDGNTNIEVLMGVRATEKFTR